MRLVVFGLSVSSSWGNGHATLWRGLIRELGRLGHHVAFFERDLPYYAAHRDLATLEPSELVLYPRWEEIEARAKEAVDEADVAMVTSFCPDAIPAARVVRDTPRAKKIYYDLDAPVTLAQLRLGARVAYLPEDGLGDFDLVLSFTGGRALAALEAELGARRTAPLYGSVDPEVHRPVPARARYAGRLSYLGTYSADRQSALDQLFLEPARRASRARFVLAGSLYPDAIAWPENVLRIDHLPPEEHAAFYGSSPLTLSVTRSPMAAMGYCPSGRLFEAAACGVPVLSDRWEGLETFFSPGVEILVGASTADALAALDRSDGELGKIGRAARERTLAEHTAAVRARELLELVEDV